MRGNGNLAHRSFYGDETGFNKFKLPVIGAFHPLIMSGVPARFPTLRIGFIEVSSQWVPYVIHDAAGASVAAARRCKWIACWRTTGSGWPARRMASSRMFSATPARTGSSFGTDYGHNDTSTELLALRTIRESGDVAPPVIDKILDDNARALYGLSDL